MTDESDVSSWPTVAVAAKRTGVSSSTLRRMIKDGTIAHENDGGVLRIDPDEIEALIRKPIDVNTLLSAAHAHNQSLVRLITEPAEKMLRLLIDENEHLRARCHQLEDAHIQVITHVEEAMSLQQEREIAKVSAEKKEARVDEGLHRLYDAVPVLMRQALGRGTVSKVIDSLSDEQIQMLVEIEAISPEQKELLMKVRDENQKRQKKTNGKASDTSSDNTVGQKEASSEQGNS